MWRVIIFLALILTGCEADRELVIPPCTGIDGAQIPEGYVSCQNDPR